jgi:hypothetical protein
VPVWLAWLLPVPAATLAAIAWNAWSGRDRRPPAIAETIAAHERFRAALAAPAARPGLEPDGSARLRPVPDAVAAERVAP